jgi:hypothetical protein
MKVPIPFGGWIEIEDLEDMNEMLRKQIEIQQGEILRLTIENQAAYQRGWSEAIKAATERTRKIFNECND